MDDQLLDIGLHLGALALIFGGIMLLLVGRADSLGASFRLSIEPLLSKFRSASPLSRAELADVSILAAIAMAAAAILVERNIIALVIGAALWLFRPTVQRLTRDENPMMAKANSFSIDLVIGLYLPIAIAQILLGNLFLGASLFTVIVALSWPAGGGAVPGRRWKLAAVPS